MKFNCDMQINQDNPFEGDIIDRKKFAEMLFNVIKTIDGGFVVSINAPWGEGKTTFLRNFENYLEKNNAKIVSIDAFKSDFNSNSFMAIASAINDFSNKNRELLKIHISNSFKNKIAKILTITSPLLIKIVSKIATQILVGKESCAEIQDFLSDANGALVGSAESLLDEYRSNLATIESFRKELECIALSVKKQTELPLVCIIDELDRCRPDYALDMLEKIKHFFSVNNIIFILAVNQEQLEASVNCIYGKNVDSHTYLQKFINIETSLPKNIHTNIKNDYQIYCKHLYDKFELSRFNVRIEFVTLIANASMAFGLTLRDIERAFSYIFIYYSSKTSASNRNLYVIVIIMSLFKIKYYPLFNEFKKNIVNFNSFIESTQYDIIKSLDCYKKESIHQKFALLLIKDHDSIVFNKEQKNLLLEKILEEYMSESDRTIIIPSICETMETFQINF